MSQYLKMQAPSSWNNPIVPASMMPSGQAYRLDSLNQIDANPLDVGILLGLDFNKTGGSGGPRYLPFFGDTTGLWTRPALAIGGATNKFHAWLNQGSSIATDPSGSTNHVADPLAQPILLSAVSDTALVGLLTDLSISPPYTVTALFALPATEAGDAGPACIILYNGTNAVTFDWYASAPGSPSSPQSGGLLSVGHFSDTTAPASYVGNSTVLPQYIIYSRIHNDGTNLNYSISYENLRFKQTFTETLAGIGFGSFTQVGIGFDPNPNNISATASDVICWNLTVTSP